MSGIILWAIPLVFKGLMSQKGKILKSFNFAVSALVSGLS